MRFGVFEVDLRAGELRKQGLKIKLQEQPFQVLAMLLERPGEVVTREEIRKRLWADDTFVDYDHSLGTAINKIREALGDDADTPRYVETLPRRGYRFIAPVDAVAAIYDRRPSSAADVPSATSASTTHRYSPEARQAAHLRRWIATAAIVPTLAIAAYWLTRPLPPPRVLRIVKLTNSGALPFHSPWQEFFPAVATDGSRVYFPMGHPQEGRGVVAQVGVGGGEVSLAAVPTQGNYLLRDISPDGTKLLVLFWGSEMPRRGLPLWVLSQPAGAPHRVGDVFANDATWSPDGRKIVFARERDLFVAASDGSGARKLATVPGHAYWPRFSPDGRLLRFTLYRPEDGTRSLWEMSAGGTNLRPLLPGWNKPPMECCGSWTPDGKYFVFQSWREGASNIWAIREKAGLFRKRSAGPVQITAGPLQFGSAMARQDGNALFAIGWEDRSELVRFDLTRRQFVPYLAGTSASWVDVSRDRKWVAYTTGAESVLWRSRADGGERLQLTFPPMQVWVPNWSPDGKQIAFMGKLPGKTWKIYIVPAEGGIPRQLIPGEGSESDPRWSPDGSSLAFGSPPDYIEQTEIPKAIHIINLATKQVTRLPGSDGLFAPRWSPDGRYIAALPLDQTRMLLFDLTTGKWEGLTNRTANNPQWSRDSRHLYFSSSGTNPGVYRVSISDRKLERILKREDIPRADVVDFVFDAVAPDGSLLVWLAQRSSDLYALDWEAP